MRGRQLNLVLKYPSGHEGEFSVQEALGEESTKVIELSGRKKNGTTFAIEARLFEWEGRNGAEYGALLRDISARKREMERIRVLAQVDTLTGLANRYTLREHLDALLMEAEMNHGEIAVLLLDLDKFKDINDSLGHTGGDQLLAAAAKRLTDLSPAQQLAARLGGDEFALLLAAPDARRAAESVAAEVCRRLKEHPFTVHGAELQVSCSIGIAIFPEDSRSPEELLSGADLALYQAKRSGGGNVSFFTQEMKKAVAERLTLQSELERALRKGEFELFYQPQVSLPDARLIGAEALIRWRHPQRGLLSPGQFMSVVHASPLSNDVAMWVLENACRQGNKWRQMGHAIQIGVNLSPSQLRLPDFPAAVAAVLHDTRLPPYLLELEVTEDILLQDDDHVGEIFVRLRDLGVRLSFDDFGTGYGSLSYLKKFPFDRMKIDRSFVTHLQPNSDDAAIVSSTIALSKLLGMSTIAEGIEDPDTIELLVGMGCSEGQGFLFGKPLPLIQFERKWLPGDEFAARNVVEATANAA
jgi:diguanylate cyclase (GGDEF)-like protein